MNRDTYIKPIAFALIVLGFMAVGKATYEQGGLGAAVDGYVEVPLLTKTCGEPTWEHTVKRNSDGRLFVFNVTEAEYADWLQKTQTTPGTPPPKYDGYTWVSSVGGKENCTVATTTLKAGEFYTVREGATNTPLYVYKSGSKTFSTSTKP